MGFVCRIRIESSGTDVDTLLSSRLSQKTFVIVLFLLIIRWNVVVVNIIHGAGINFTVDICINITFDIVFEIVFDFAFEIAFDVSLIPQIPFNAASVISIVSNKQELSNTTSKIDR